MVLINQRQDLMSRSKLEFDFKEKLKLNNQIIKSPSKKVSIGDKLTLQIPEPEKASIKPYKPKLDII